MSRLGKKAIEIPANTDITISENTVVVKGPKGELSLPFLPANVTISKEEEGILVAPKNEEIFSRALWGTYASHIRNMITGVHTPYSKKLIIEGVGYRAELKGDVIVMQLGFSHPVELAIPEGLTLEIVKNEVTITGISKELVGQFAAKIRSKKKPEPYKGKGIRYSDEVVRRKQGKKTV